MSEQLCVFEGVPSGFSLQVSFFDLGEREKRTKFIHGLSEEDAKDRVIVLETMKNMDLPLKDVPDTIPYVISSLESTGKFEELSKITQFLLYDNHSSERLVWFLDMLDVDYSLRILTIESIVMCYVPKEIPSIHIDVIN